MNSFSNLGLVFLGGGLGSVFRYLVGQAFSKSTFPWATLSVNLVGSFAIGFCLRQFEGDGSKEPWKLLIVVGLLGGFTTFSAFSADNLALIRAGSTGQALVNMAVQVGGGLTLAALGYSMAPPAIRS